MPAQFMYEIPLMEMLEQPPGREATTVPTAGA
jgi:hypothetical protein